MEAEYHYERSQQTKGILEATDTNLKPQTIDARGHFNWKLHKAVPAEN